MTVKAKPKMNAKAILFGWIKWFCVVVVAWLACAGLVVLYHVVAHNERKAPTEVLVTRTVDKQTGVVCYVTPQAIACVRVGVDL